MFTTTIDVNCPLSTAQSIKDKIGDAVKNFYTIDNEYQLNSYFASANDDDFINSLMDQLKASAIKSATIALTSLLLSAIMLA